MKPRQVIEECEKYLVYVSEALYNLSTQYRIGAVDRNRMLKYSESLYKTQKELEDLRVDWIKQEDIEQKKISQQYQFVEEQASLKQNKIEEAKKSLCQACGHYKWVHEDKCDNQCGSEKSNCKCEEFIKRK